MLHDYRWWWWGGGRRLERTPPRAKAVHFAPRRAATQAGRQAALPDRLIIASPCCRAGRFCGLSAHPSALCAVRTTYATPPVNNQGTERGPKASVSPCLRLMNSGVNRLVCHPSLIVRSQHGAVLLLQQLLVLVRSRILLMVALVGGQRLGSRCRGGGRARSSSCCCCNLGTHIGCVCGLRPHAAADHQCPLGGDLSKGSNRHVSAVGKRRGRGAGLGNTENARSMCKKNALSAIWDTVEEGSETEW